MTAETTLPILQINNVVKQYSSKRAVDEITMTIPNGIIFGLLGPNGAGKTTLIRMITHITKPDSGDIALNGEPLMERHQGLIGYMPEERGLYKKMKVGEQLLYLLRLKGLSANDARAASKVWLERFELEKWTNNKIDELSKGMQQKVQFIATVAHKPPLIILDEPFSGLDPINSQLIEDALMDLRNNGSAIIFSTHRMEQAQEFCDRIALINNGKVILDGTVRALRKQFAQSLYLLETEEDNLPELQLPTGVTLLSRKANAYTLELSASISPKELLTNLNQQATIARFEHILPTLREIFIEQVKKIA